MTQSIKPISRRSFKQIKHIAALLRNEVNYNNEHYPWGEYDNEFEFKGFTHIKGDKLANEISSNKDLTRAANLVISRTVDSTMAFYASENVDWDDPLGIDRLLKIINGLVKLGRTGVAKRIDTNKRLSKKISDFYAIMNFKG